MRTERIGVVGAIAGLVLGGLVVTAGCVGADDEVSGSDEGEAELQGGSLFHRRHRRPDAGNVGGAAGTTGGGAGPATGGGGATGGGTAGTSGDTAVDGGAVADCDICTKAQQCCEVVQAEEPGCSFSAATCASMAGAALPAYVNACLTYVVTVRGAWGGNPPAECR